MLTEIGATEVIHCDSLVDTYSFELVAKKIKSLSSLDDYGYKFEIEKLRKALEEQQGFLDARLNALLNSSSWKITAPLRSISFFIKKIFFFVKEFIT